MHSLILWLLLGLSSITCPLYATTHQTADNKHRIEQALHQAFPGIEISAIEAGPYPGLEQVTAGTDVFYITSDGRYLLHGALLDLHQAKDNWNLREQARKKIIKTLLAKLNPKDLIIFKPTKAISTVYVFTDVDCIYCQKFHANIEAILAKGIEIRYLAFPRAGLNSSTYQKEVNIWCSDNPQAAMTSATKGEVIPNKSCDNPVNAQLELGKKIGVMGTPTLIFADGTILASYLTAEQLLVQVEKHTPKSPSNE